MVSPPKPWESAAGTGATSVIGTAPEQQQQHQQQQLQLREQQLREQSGELQTPPSLPARPTSFDSFGSNPVFTVATAGATGPYAAPYGSGVNSAGLYGNSMYDQSYGGGYSGYGSYNRMSSYNRFGGGYGVGTGYGAGTYGGYGQMGYGAGVGGYGMNMMGRPGFNPNNPNEIPLSMQIEQSTQYAFQSIDQVVQAFTGFSQMLESTFFATHSSFMAMVGVAEQLGNLRNYLGGIISAIAVTDYLKKWIYHFLGKPMPVDSKTLTSESFEKFAQHGGSVASKPNRRPVYLFLMFMIGFPWLMSKLIQRLQAKQLEAAASAAADPNRPLMAGNAPILGPDGRPLQLNQIKDLEFCKALYDYVASSPAELSFKKGDVIAILSKIDPATMQPLQWWRGRLRSGEIGHFPANYAELLEKKAVPASSVGSGSPTIAESIAPGTFPTNVSFKSHE
ncbi:Peroxisomal membrane protein PAS20 [Physocladia obscura]|uniref:Peroxisomal membrane protein PEX13 n=1 Tax=Physocladia obscura TaxID=109957 RepID=A0AAD5TC18_9FUNG|nr:Peroxisomal membrane protein PAS20 [Physocladia obscura]